MDRRKNLLIGIVVGVVTVTASIYVSGLSKTLLMPFFSSTEYKRSESAAAPELTAGDWINSEPLTLKGLRGRVVLIDFWTFGCINCRNTLPSLKNWHERYRDKGLTIIGVHSPEFDEERDVDNLRRAVASLGISYPVVTDNDYQTWKAYDVAAWPTVFLLDKQGRIRWKHVGEGSYDEAERMIQKLLAEEEQSVMQGNTVDQSTYYRKVQVDGLSIFYREAGPKDAPTLLLLHGLPSSSRMFEPLFNRLSDRFHLVAPDYPGFGHSDWPDPKKFAYTFDHLAGIVNHFTETLRLSHYTLYMQDYGGPVGFRMALAHPERIDALIVQDAVAHNEGLGENWKTRRAFWADRAANESALRQNLLSLQTTRTRHVGNDPNVERYDPDLWTDEFAFLNQPGQAEIQSDLFYDYRTNVDAYPKWQAWMREKQPRLLVIWGKYDLSFDLGEPERYRKDVPNAQVHVLDAGHFALDTAADEIATLVQGFVNTRR